jgi:3-dehydroquinate synthase
LFEFLEQNIGQLNRRDPDILVRVIAWCCRCKAAVVEQDERELSGRRAILNYGHTLGHALESVFGYGRLLHGEAVAIGMTFAASLACQLQRFREKDLERQTALLAGLGLPTTLPELPTEEILAAMRRDKKVAAGQLMLILPDQIGSVQAIAAPNEDLLVRVMSSLKPGNVSDRMP